MQQVQNLGLPCNSRPTGCFHKLLVGGVPVQYQQGGETRGDFDAAVDWADATKKQQVRQRKFLGGQQFTPQRPAPHAPTRYCVVRQRSAAGASLDQKPSRPGGQHLEGLRPDSDLQRQIPDLFQFNEVLVIADAAKTRLGSLSSNAERFMQWRTGVTACSSVLGQFSRQRWVRGVLAPRYLLRLSALFVLFEGRRHARQEKITDYHRSRGARRHRACGGCVARMQ